jgi:hypothetical protein
VLQFLEELATLDIVQAGKTVLPSRDQPITIYEGHPENGVIYIAVRVGLDQLHVWYAVDIDTVMQVGDCQIIFLDIGMRTSLFIS